jgi:hypothetical protein
MAEKMSTGMCNYLLDQGSLSAALASLTGITEIRIYDGTPPATADAAATGTLLCVVSDASTGSTLAWDTAGAVQGGVMQKETGQVWSGVVLADGVASYYRVVDDNDDDSLSTTYPRLQGTIGVGGADMNLGTTTLVNGATFTIAYASQAFIPT